MNFTRSNFAFMFGADPQKIKSYEERRAWVVAKAKGVIEEGANVFGHVLQAELTGASVVERQQRADQMRKIFSVRKPDGSYESHVSSMPESARKIQEFNSDLLPENDASDASLEY